MNFPKQQKTFCSNEKTQSKPEAHESADEKQFETEIQEIQDEMKLVNQQIAGRPGPETEDLSQGWNLRAFLKQADVEPNLACVYGVPDPQKSGKIVSALADKGRWCINIDFEDSNGKRLLEDIGKIYEGADMDYMWYWHDRKYELARQRANVEYCARIRHLQQSRKKFPEMTAKQYLETTFGKETQQEIRRIVSEYDDLPFKLSLVMLRPLYSVFRPLVVLQNAHHAANHLNDKIWAHDEMEYLIRRPGPHVGQGALGPIKEILMLAPMLWFGDSSLKNWPLYQTKPIGYKVPEFRVDYLRPYGYHHPRFLNYETEIHPNLK